MPDLLPTTRVDPFDPPPELFGTDQPLRPLAYPDGHEGWLVTSHTLAKAVLADQRFSSKLELRRTPVRRPVVDDFRVGEPAAPGFFIAMDPPDHTRLRRQLTGQFTVRRMNQLTPRIEQIVAEHLDAMEQAGPPADLVQAFALPIPSLVICELLGVPYADRAEFQQASSVLLGLDSTDEQAAVAMKSITGYLAGLVGRKRAEPEDDLLSGLTEAGELSDDELVGVALLLLVAGHETTANMLGLGTFALLQHPEQAEALRSGAVPVDNAVEELMRYLSVIQFGTTRTALEDVELAGRLITKGQVLTLSLPAANRDPEKFPNPAELDLGGDAHGHLAFGHGVHQCLGQQLARIEMRIGYAALFERFPGLSLAVPPSEVPVRDDMAIYGVHRLPVSW
ncbi:cytochrome [Prauserella marina]|uniref:Cytochrome P450 n=1 Tax=Prauserella marina TaxID=530584 RepID=A0A222VMA8_9PSEU|nr:cytochrome P450 [Prauserella marina]ASR35058.1 cytochrome [Prauserella marina]PWV85200.1 cytochrome P450 [Prauserella marina]SDC02518.1 Cytochrome P450 [Prauserella marina]